MHGVKSDGIPADPVKLMDPQMVDLARIIAGGSFGALALSDGKPRITTTKCLVRTHFLVLSRTDWKKTEQDIKKRKTYDRVQFVRKIPIFCKLSTTYLNQRLMPNFFDVEVNKGQFIIKEGDPADRVYIVKAGEFQVTKKMIHKESSK